MKRTSVSVVSGALVALLAPIVVLAAPNLAPLTGYKTSFVSLINDILVPVLYSIAFIVFIWGVYKYFILGAAEEKSREEGKQFVMWGIIGFVIILTMWALVALVAGTLDLAPGGTTPALPTL